MSITLVVYLVGVVLTAAAFYHIRARYFPWDDRLSPMKLAVRIVILSALWPGVLVLAGLVRLFPSLEKWIMEG
jgi:hypothetical protein